MVSTQAARPKINDYGVIPESNRPIRVMHFISDPRSWHFSNGQPQFLRSIGYNFIGVSAPGPLLQRFAEVNGVTVYSVPVARKFAILSDLVSTFCLLRVLRKVRPDILHAHFSKPGIIGMVAGFLGGVPIRIYHNHGMALSSERGWKRLILWVVERVSCSLAHRVVYVAPSVLNDALRMRLCCARKAEAVLSANGLETDTRFSKDLYGPDCRKQLRSALHIPPEAFVVGFVGRILKIKGIEELVRAWQILAPAHPLLHLLIVGEADPRAPVSELTKLIMKTEPRIHLAGFVEEPAPMYLAMDVLALPSYHEGLGYSLLEAAAMELPVIGTRIPGIVDAVQENDSGLLVKPRNPEQLADAIRTYIEKPALAFAHGRAGRTFVAHHFRRSTVWHSILRIYDQLIVERLPSRTYDSTMTSRTQTSSPRSGAGPL
jgi:glycosyltransferase involved in cell wall biosynthesis